ncbi:hypothetical protein OJAV_G00072980 [Oryzias javanicus]|uniref:DDE Tnp4 domain-containing protein n=1 Tax=Oryzias javanicus TaxID=123683 RepID=A0A3S2MXM0_ORYJA|nr:hypothetical protein OJAV_G00072980 [Oryzias javanicus]
MMKTRFRGIFLQVLEVHHTFVPHVVTACAVLHNICPCADDTEAPEEDVEVMMRRRRRRRRRLVWRSSAVLSGRTNYLLRFLSWGRYNQTFITGNSIRGQPALQTLKMDDAVYSLCRSSCKMFQSPPESSSPGLS